MSLNFEKEIYNYVLKFEFDKTKMKVHFSKRHEKIIEKGQLKVYFNINQRTKICYLLQDYEVIFDEVTETNWRYSESSSEKVYKDLLRAYGYRALKSYVNDEFIEVKQIYDFIPGTKPEFILDIIEFFYCYIIDDFKKDKFSEDINQLLTIERKPVRFIDGEFFRIDSEFLETEVLFNAEQLLKNGSFDKAHNDFIDARNRLSTGDYTGCIISVNNSLESYLKKLLDKKDENQGALKKALIKSNIIPDYFNGFLEHFEGLVQSIFTIANKSSRHGQIDMPDTKNAVDESIASFCLNLVGTLVVFVMNRTMDSKKILDKKGSDTINPIDKSDDLPF